MLVSELQSWGQCAGCQTNIWIEPNLNPQCCTCSCGACRLLDDARVGGPWTPLTDDTFQVIVDNDLSHGMGDQ